MAAGLAVLQRRPLAEEMAAVLLGLGVLVLQERGELWLQAASALAVLVGLVALTR